MIEKAIREIQAAQELAYQTEKRYFEIRAQHVAAITKLTLKKAKLYKEGKISLRNNADIQEAQLIQYAKKEYMEVKELEKQLYLAEGDYRTSKRAWESWQAICLLQSGI